MVEFSNVLNIWNWKYLWSIILRSILKKYMLMWWIGGELAYDEDHWRNAVNLQCNYIVLGYRELGIYYWPDL